MSDERELKQLYQAMRSEDARQAPSFARVVARPTAANVGYLRAVAITVALVLVAAMFGINALRRRELPQPVAKQAPAIQTQAPAVSPAPAVVATSPSVTKMGPRRPTKKPPSISDWKSPTDAWLQTPDESFRNSVPSLSYSSVKLND